jgi:hypothetical protein
VLLVQHQQPVETFRADGAYEPLGNQVGLRRAKRRTNDLNPVAPKHVVKASGEFLIPIANQKPNPLRALRQSPRELTSLLDDPWRARGTLGRRPLSPEGALCAENREFVPHYDDFEFLELIRPKAQGR